MEIASFSYASIWTTIDISRESSVKRATVDNYLQILEDLLLAFSLPVFSRRAKRRLIAHSKFYFFDVGIFRALRPRGILDVESEMEGNALEGLVAQHLRTWTLNQKEKHSLSFWHTATQLEVDFIIYGPRGFWAIEVKRSAELSPSDVKGLAAFQEEYPEAKCLIVNMGKRKAKLSRLPSHSGRRISPSPHS